MAEESSSEPEQDDAEGEFVEVDPTGRYGRYGEVLGKGAFKTVYKAFDELEGIEVAWNQVKVAAVLRNSEDLERLYSEVHLLKTLKHKSIIKFYHSWVDTMRDNINFITEVFTSGTLRQYRKKHKHVDIRALKKWTRQILSGLLYLHSNDPPVIHRDLKCDNIFVNGNQGEVKIGDLGLAAILRHAHSAHSVIGTPEFMAPELYEEEYNELVDIYAFGMCLLELVTFEYPYVECTNAAQIYKKVMLGIKPASLGKVKDPEVKQFIEKCIANVSERLSASELLMDPFLQLDAENEGIGHYLFPVQDCADNIGNPNASTKEVSTTGLDFTVEGERKDIIKIFLKLRIADSTGQVHNIHFPFDIEADTSTSVATEMVAELDLTDQDVTTIAAMIDAEIQAHVPEWLPIEALDVDHDPEVKFAGSGDPEAEDELSSLRNESSHPSGGLVLERLSSGRIYWSDSPKAGSPSGTSSSNQQSDSPHVTGGCRNNLVTVPSSTPLELPSHSAKYMANHNHKETSISFQSADQSGYQQVGGDGYLCTTSLENEPKNVESVSEKLEHLLVEQRKELDELKKKHDMAIEDILRQLPPGLREITLSMCCLKI